MQASTLTLDGRDYRVRTTFDTLSREFTIIEGQNAGTAASGAAIPDILGTQYSYSLTVEPDPQHATDYDDFYEAISAPVNSHTVRMPYAQSFISFECRILSGADVFGGKAGAYNRWRGLEISFVPFRPQRRPEA